MEPPPLTEYVWYCRDCEEIRDQDGRTACDDVDECVRWDKWGGPCGFIVCADCREPLAHVHVSALPDTGQSNVESETPPPPGIRARQQRRANHSQCFDWRPGPGPRDRFEGDDTTTGSSTNGSNGDQE